MALRACVLRQSRDAGRRAVGPGARQIRVRRVVALGRLVWPRTAEDDTGLSVHAPRAGARHQEGQASARHAQRAATRQQ